MRDEWKKTRIAKILKSPQAALLGSFAIVILVGTVALSLPWAHAQGKVGVVDALFTSTSAVCVTGLTTVDTGSDYTFFGQVVILLLIQVGGLGVMTFAALAFQIAGRRLSLQSQAVLSDAFFQKDIAAEFHRAFKTILVLTFAIEAAGAVLLFFFVRPFITTGSASFFSIFHAVSAFCNAGFALRADNLVGLRQSMGVLFVVMALIVAGGLGYMVLNEVWAAARNSESSTSGRSPGRFSLQTRLVLGISAGLIVAGWLGLICFGLTPQETSWGEAIVNALFQSVTARTAGFNSVDIGQLPRSSLFVLLVLMFVGGSPGSCAGGVKTTTIAIWLAGRRASLLGQRDVHLLDRRMPYDLVNRADLLMALAALWNIVGFLFLLNSEAQMKCDTLGLLFEQISAFGTVGLSTGLTPDLSTAGKLWLSATMFVGRLGPLTVALWMFPKGPVSVNYPKGTVMIG